MQILKMSAPMEMEHMPLPISMELYPLLCANLMNAVFWINGFSSRYGCCFVVFNME